MTNYVVVLLTNLAQTEHSRPNIVRTVLPAVSVTDAKALCRSVHGTEGYDWRRQAEVCIHLRWAGGSIRIPTDQLASLGVSIEDALKELDQTVEVEASSRPMKMQPGKGVPLTGNGPF